MSFYEILHVITLFCSASDSTQIRSKCIKDIYTCVVSDLPTLEYRRADQVVQCIREYKRD